ncbi:hypothetical protein NECAME_16520 [Necator americanus]|uniref:Uncharacterized protein n=1 Tax=Necator americanus TaxID=51031 RepID=W2TW19_NECAM|nr:hypothetical protein NECAME_16520 [Necator americanus]ETN86048.1 hypothetical protein NECAME_16520 [Necator americanus]
MKNPRRAERKSLKKILFVITTAHPPEKMAISFVFVVAATTMVASVDSMISSFTVVKSKDVW